MVSVINPVDTSFSESVLLCCFVGSWFAAMSCVSDISDVSEVESTDFYPRAI